MEVLILLIFVSLVLVGGAVILFLNGIRGGDFEHAERLSLLPLEDDDRPPGPKAASTQPPSRTGREGAKWTNTSSGRESSPAGEEGEPDLS